MIYVASPYYSPIIGVRESRFEKVRDFTERMILSGYHAFSPILYCHPICVRTGMSSDSFLRFALDALRRSEALYLLQLPGWEQSKGVSVELNVCKAVSIPVVRFDETYRLISEEWAHVLPEGF